MNDKTKEQTRIEFEQNFTSRYTAHKLGRMMTMGGDLADEYKDPRVNYCWVLWKDAHEMYAPRWISVDDGMPRIGQAILSKDRLGRVYKTTFNGRSFKCDLVVWDHTPVVEWMPLPKQEQAE